MHIRGNNLRLTFEFTVSAGGIIDGYWSCPRSGEETMRSREEERIVEAEVHLKQREDGRLQDGSFCG